MENFSRLVFAGGEVRLVLVNGMEVFVGAEVRSVSAVTAVGWVDFSEAEVRLIFTEAAAGRLIFAERATFFEAGEIFFRGSATFSGGAVFFGERAVFFVGGAVLFFGRTAAFFAGRVVDLVFFLEVVMVLSLSG